MSSYQYYVANDFSRPKINVQSRDCVGGPREEIASGFPPVGISVFEGDCLCLEESVFYELNGGQIFFASFLGTLLLVPL